MVVMFYKVAGNIELANAETLPYGKFRVRFLLASRHKLFIS